MSKYDSIMAITSRPDITFTRGEGTWIWDSKNNKYLDFIQGWAVNCLGHNHPHLSEALTKQAQTLINCSPAFYNGPMLELADLLVAHSCLDQVFFANSGAEANEGAIKLARKWGQLHRHGAYQIITTEHAFHGRTLATMSASGKAQWEDLFAPKVPGFAKVPLNDLRAIETAITEQTVAVLLEPIQGEAGVFVADGGYLRELRALTAERDLLLICDEIQTGIGRTGTLFAYEDSGVEPDIMTLGKGLGGGVPLAALLAKKAVCCFEPGDQGGTFNGNALMTAVGLAVLKEVAEPDFLAGVQEKSQYLQTKLKTYAAQFDFGTIRGRGLLLALDLQRDMAAEITTAALQQGLLLNAPRPDTLRFMPALNVSEQEIDHMIEILERATATI